MTSSSLMTNRNVGFVACCLTVLGLFWMVFEHAIRESLQAGYTSHVIVMPFVVAFLIWSSRSKVFSSPQYAFMPAACLAALALVLLLAARALTTTLGTELVSFFTLLAALVLIVAGFLGFYGKAALRNARFPLLVLFLTAPIPSPVMDRAISILQSGSTTLTHAIFVALGVPVIREGFVLSVPGATIEVARECSGINSTIALFITTLLLAHETLQTTWRRALLLLLSIPLSIVKNAIRITTLTILAIRVDPSFLTGRLHHEGGFVFFLIALAIMYPAWKALYNGEKKEQQNLSDENSAPSIKPAWTAQSTHL